MSSRHILLPSTKPRRGSSDEDGSVSGSVKKPRREGKTGSAGELAPETPGRVERPKRANRFSGSYKQLLAFDDSDSGLESKELQGYSSRKRARIGSPRKSNGKDKGKSVESTAYVPEQSISSDGDYDNPSDVSPSEESAFVEEEETDDEEEIEDEEYILNPEEELERELAEELDLFADDEDDNNETMSEEDEDGDEETTLLEDMDLNLSDPFINMLYQNLDILRDASADMLAAKNTAFWDAQNLPMTIKCASIISHTSKEYLMKILLPGISQVVREICVDEICKDGSFDADVLLRRLPTFRAKDNRHAVYLGIVFDDDRNEHQTGADGYTGSTNNAHRRITEHRRAVTRLKTGIAHDEELRSLLYNRLSVPGADVEWKVLAVFRNPIPKAYLYTLESIFMIWMGTYKRSSPGLTHTMSSYQLADKIQADLNLASAPWKGLNIALPLLQGFTHPGSRKESPCVNCGTMTYPAGHKMTGKWTRRCLAIADRPLDSEYLCGFCAYRRRVTGRLPAAEKARAAKEKTNASKDRQTNRANGGDNVCAGCSIKESDDPNVRMTTASPVWHRPHPSGLFPGQSFCTSCLGYITIQGRLPTASVIVARRQREAISEKDPKRPKPDVCDTPTCDFTTLKYVRKLNLYLCNGEDTNQCYRHGLDNGQAPGKDHISMVACRKKMKADREAGRPIQCYKCGRLEPGSTRKRHLINKDGPLCRTDTGCRKGESGPKSSRRPSPTICESPGCICTSGLSYHEETDSWLCDNKDSLLCYREAKRTHQVPTATWVAAKQERLAKKAATAKSTRPKPKHCESPGCTSDSSLIYVADVDAFLCTGKGSLYCYIQATKTHQVPTTTWVAAKQAKLAKKAATSKPTRPRPKICESPGCTSDSALVYVADVDAYLCSGSLGLRCYYQARKTHQIPSAEWVASIQAGRKAALEKKSK